MRQNMIMFTNAIAVVEHQPKVSWVWDRSKTEISHNVTIIAAMNFQPTVTDKAK